MFNLCSFTSVKKSFGLILLVLCSWQVTFAQEAGVNPSHSVARVWNEALLAAIRRDFARPTVHARNLFHSSVVTYDAWAVFAADKTPWLLNRTQQTGTRCEFSSDLRDEYRNTTQSLEESRRQVISFANYRLLSSRFASSPGAQQSLAQFDTTMTELGYDTENTSTDITTGSLPALGNYIAKCMIDYGYADGSNERENFVNRYYTSINPPLDPSLAGQASINDPNRWQSLMLDSFIDQSGIETDIPEFLSAEWGNVRGFALSTADQTVYQRGGQEFRVFHDPGPPALFSTSGGVDATDYSWGHSLVALWSAHLDPSDGVMIDISPGSLGNSLTLPSTISELRDFYNDLEGGTDDPGHVLNPVTGEVYAPNVVLRGDYTRVLAEFWADGPDSETPPGHWFSIYNQAVADHPDFSRRFEGVGEPLTKLEFDIRSYFILGAAMHDAAIAAWSIKGWYDYVRPISALRYLATLGQSTDPAASNYDPQGVPLVNGRIETVQANDILAGNGGVNVGKIKVRAWRGPSFISDPATSAAGVGWILLENWWPYQRPTFVTPPFAGYVSGHSTFSRAAAEALEKITGDDYFPGGLAEFVARKNEFLVFEEGPSTDVRLQWATYRDASDQTSLSRIWGGIHPPVDDAPGRLIGIAIADNVFDRAKLFFSGQAPLSDTDIVPTFEFTGTSSGGCSVFPTNGSYDPMLLLLLLGSYTGLMLSHRRKQVRPA